MVVSVLTLMFCPVMHGQATGSFSGNVLDKSGSGIAGATVIATSQEHRPDARHQDGQCRTLPAPFAPGRDLYRARRCDGLSKR